MNIRCKKRVPIAKAKHHSLVFFVTDFNTKGILREHRKTNGFGLNLKKTMDFVYKTIQGKSSPKAGVCRFHEFLPVGPSSIIESTVESIINERHKKKQKAQWSREGAHNVLQIRTSRASKDWEEEWNYVTDRFYVPRYNKEAKVAV